MSKNKNEDLETITPTMAQEYTEEALMGAKPEERMHADRSTTFLFWDNGRPFVIMVFPDGSGCLHKTGDTPQILERL